MSTIEGVHLDGLPSGLLLASPPIAQFSVEGLPQPAGSKRAFVPLHPRTKQPYTDKHGRIVVSVVDDNPKAKAWKKLVAEAAQRAYRGPLVECALCVTFKFFLPRPQWHSGTGRNAGVVKQSAPRFMVTRPDVLKLSRAAEDALTGSVWVDDSQIVHEIISKAYGSPRVEITISEVL